MKNPLFILSLYLLLGHCSWAQVTFILRDLPPLPQEQNLYLAHNHNQWQAGDPQYLFKEGVLRTDLAGKALEFKVCGASWDLVEASADGYPRQNRRAKLKEGDTLFLTVQAWEDHSDHPPRRLKVVTANPPFRLAGASRKVWIYLPEDYQKKASAYPVLYLQDAQNLFQGLRGSQQKWRLGQVLDSMQLPLIVVAINHGEEKRIAELSPFPQEQYGGGQGNAYLDFLVGQVKPWVDSQYSTLPSRSHTYIGGSSLGGLISLYALLKHPDVFGGAMIFSPAYWFNPGVLEMALHFPPKNRTFVYQLVGDQEGSKPLEFTRDLEHCAKIFDQQPEVWKHHSQIIEGGKHNEAFWHRQLAPALAWLFENTTLKAQP